MNWILQVVDWKRAEVRGAWGCALLPIAVWLYLRLPLVGFDNFTDAVFYLSYSQNFAELVSRYGFIYYATRFGAILPDAVSATLFGHIGGIVVLRLALAASVSASIFVLFYRQGGVVAGWIAAAFWALSPVTARLMVTTYLDSTSVPLLMLALCWWACGARRSIAGIGIGVLLAFVISAHLYLLIMVPLLFPFVIGARWETSESGGVAQLRATAMRLLGEAAWVLLGIAATMCVAIFYYWKVWDMAALWSPTVELMRGMAGGDTDIWRLPLGPSLAKTPAWFAPLPLLFWLGVRSIRGGALVRGAWVALLGATMLFWLGDLVGGAYALSMPFYFSFLFPAVVFAGGAAAADIATPMLTAKRSYGVLCVIAIALPVIAAAWLPWSLTAWLTGGVVVSVCAVGVLGLRMPVPALITLLILGIASNLALHSRFFGQFLGDYALRHPNEQKLVSASRELFGVLPRASESDDSVRFWFPDDTPSELRMLQSFWLHTFSKLEGEPQIVAPYPDLRPEHAEFVRSSDIRHVVIIDHDLARLQGAIKNVQAAGLRSKVQNFGELSGPLAPIHYAVLALDRPMESSAMSIPLDEPIIFEEADWLAPSVEAGQQLRTSRKRWMFELQWTIPEEIDPAAILGVRVRGMLKSGRIMVCILGRTGMDRPKFLPIAKTEVWRSGGDFERIIMLPEANRLQHPPARIAIQNIQPEGSKSVLQIGEIDLILK